MESSESLLREWMDELREIAIQEGKIPTEYRVNPHTRQAQYAEHVTTHRGIPVVTCPDTHSLDLITRDPPPTESAV